jgi:hypothetical protein
VHVFIGIVRNAGWPLLCLLVMACRPVAPVTITPDNVPCWADQELGSFGRDDFFCEHNQARCVGQPANTWSNAAYLLAALAIGVSWLHPRAPLRPEGLSDRAFRRLLAAACVYLAFGSALYHASVVRWAEVWDMSGTYSVVFVLLGYTAVRLIGPERRAVVVTGVISVLGVLALATVLKFHIEDFLLFPAAVVLLALSLGVLLRQGRAERTPLLAALAATTLGASVWLLDLQRILCDPHSLLQGHALWHGLTALGVVFAWRSLRGGLP